MDRVTTNLLQEFVRENQHESLQVSEQFEHFVNFATVSREYADTFDHTSVHVGKDGNPGIDGVGIIVNGAIVDDAEEIDDLLEKNKYLEVTYVFVQAKTSSSFSSGDISTFIESVRDFFREVPGQVQSEDLKRKFDLQSKILSHSGKMRANPKCSLYYVTTGTWVGDQNLVSRIESGKKDLEDTELFSTVSVTACGAREIQQYYRQSKETLDAEFDFTNKVTLPSIPGINEAHIGILPMGTILRLISDSVGNVRKAVFEDNIRDFQGSSEINERIQTTLKDDEAALRFAVLNNGITIVCRNLRFTGARCKIDGFQVVNGCQTCHVLFNCSSVNHADNVFVPVKLIATQDEDIVNSIIRSTNSQNEVKPEQLEAMTEFQKTLETFYKTYRKTPGELFYERRSKQYASEPIEKTRIITIPTQIKSFSALFLAVPHRVAGYYGTIRERMNDQIFKPEHKPIAYYACGYAWYRLETHFRVKGVDFNKWRSLKWYMLMIFARMAAGAPPQAATRECERYCEKLIKKLDDTQEVKRLFDSIATRLSKINPKTDKDSVKTLNFRDSILDGFKDLLLPEKNR